MKIIAYIVIFILMIALLLFDYKNAETTVSVFLFNDSLKMVLLPLVVIIAFLGGIVAGAMYSVINSINAKKLHLAQNKKVEKYSVDKDSADLKIKTLEAKIQTLETALDKALKSQDN